MENNKKQKNNSKQNMKKFKFLNLKYIYFLILGFIFVFTYVTDVESFTPIENLDVPIGVGYDFIVNNKSDELYNIPISVYKFSTVSQNANPAIMEGSGDSIGVTRGDRQTKSNRKFILGTEKVILISDRIAEKSIYHAVNVLFNSSYVNDRAKACVIKGKAKDALSLKVKGYESAADYIEGMINDSIGFNFFSDRYSMTDVYTKIESEGKHLVLPYMAINNGDLKIIGVAIFDKYRIATILDIEQTKILNMLRENKVKGVITLKDKKGRITDFAIATRKNVDCKKDGNKYKFTIKLNLKGDIIENTIYKDIAFNDKIITEVEKEAETRIQMLAENFIKKMQNEIKLDCIELGKKAVSKYGRRKDINWDDVVCHSDIKVMVNFKLDRIGRGTY